MTNPLTPREKVALKPCPFCGGDAVAGSNFDNDHYVMCGADCDRCGGMVGYMKTEMAAIENWNRRTALASGSGDHAELARLKAAMSKSNDEICQSLGKALGYPWFKDDQRNFPGATEGNGVCVGDHVAESIADEAASRISALLAENAALRAERDQIAGESIWWAGVIGDGSHQPSGEVRSIKHLHPAMVKPIYEANKGTAVADVIAGLIFSLAITENREQFLVADANERRTEAERKLAEAVGLLRETLTPGSFEGEAEINTRIRTFLSKEAERG